jgi:hypothetical protein
MMKDQVGLKEVLEQARTRKWQATLRYSFSLLTYQPAHTHAMPYIICNFMTYSIILLTDHLTASCHLPNFNALVTSWYHPTTALSWCRWWP